MTKNPRERLTFEGIQKHPFFSGLNWKLIESRSVQSPMRLACGLEEEDTSAFDVEFTKMQPAITPIDTETRNLLSRPESQEPFSGFSYYPE
jgi:hypothetical protein